MALNPPISIAGIPLRLDGEFLMLERKHIEAEFKVPVFGKKTGKGKVFLKNHRENIKFLSYISQQLEWYSSLETSPKVSLNHLIFLFYRFRMKSSNNRSSDQII
jgi:hypothetical protein